MAENIEKLYLGTLLTNEFPLAYSREHTDEINEWRASNGKHPCDKRKLRRDTVVMCSTVIKPPAELMARFSADSQLRLLRDSLKIFETLISADNVKAAAFHFDERVPHLHIFWEPMIDEHRLCAREMHNKDFFRKLNCEMPKQLRERGWSMVDDCKMFDAQDEKKLREEMGEEKYKEYRHKLRAERGRSSRIFKYEVEQEIGELEKRKVLLMNEIKSLTADADSVSEKIAEQQEQLLRIVDIPP